MEPSSKSTKKQSLLIFKPSAIYLKILHRLLIKNNISAGVCTWTTTSRAGNYTAGNNYKCLIKCSFVSVATCVTHFQLHGEVFKKMNTDNIEDSYREYRSIAYSKTFWAVLYTYGCNYQPEIIVILFDRLYHILTISYSSINGKQGQPS